MYYKGTIEVVEYMCLYTGYTQKNGAVSISRHVGKQVVTPTEHQL